MLEHLTHAALVVGLGFGAVSLALALDTVLAVPCPDFETRGRRAANRLRALKEGFFFALFLPVIRFFTGYAALIKAPKVRARLEVWLRQADEPLGLVPSEVLGLSILAAIVAALVTAVEFQPILALPAALLAAYVPYDRMRGLANERIRAVAGSLPTFTDLLVLSMESGMDFISSIRLLISKTGDSKTQEMPIREELIIFLHQLDLGITRRQALLNMAERVPAEAVQSFVTSIIQAEEKGMSLRDVLRIQADVLRQKRIQDAVAYIEVANLKMMGPVMVIIVALMVVILAPVLANVDSSLSGAGGGLMGGP